MYNGVAYQGSGCKGDENVCKDGSNQDGIMHKVINSEDYNFYFSCLFESECKPKLQDVGFYLL